MPGGLVVALAVLAVWRITHLVQAEDGPFAVVVRVRRVAGRLGLGAALDCFYCLSVWVAAPIAGALTTDWRAWLLLWPALSAGAIVVERMTSRDVAPPVPLYFEHPGVDDVVLRQPASPARLSDPGDAEPGARA